MKALVVEVIAATREMLGDLQPEITERIGAGDATAETIRHEGRRYERILVRRPDWAVRVTLEWDARQAPPRRRALRVPA